MAFSYPLKRHHYDYKKAITTIEESAGGNEFHDYVPNVPKSSIVKYEEFAEIWKMFPDYVRIRVPELLYACDTDGYNVHSLYRKCEPYENEYRFSIVLV
jgi:hypothetical protein